MSCPVVLPCPAFLPMMMGKIYDWTQASLMVAAGVGLALALRDVVGAYQHGCIVHKKYGFRTYCVVEILDTLFLLPCTFQLIFCIAKYDDRVQSRRTEAKEQTAALTETYRRYIADMDDQLDKLCKSNVFMAQNAFEERKRDFATFLRRLAAQLRDCACEGVEDPGQLAAELKTFIRQWLEIYGEASVDVERRLEAKLPEAALRLEDPVALLTSAELVVRAVKTSVGASYTSDTQVLERLRDTPASEPSSALVPHLSGRRLSGERRLSERRRSHAEVRRSLRDLPQVAMAWFECCVPQCFAHLAGSSSELSCLLCRVKLLGREHVLLLLAAAVGLCLIVITAVFPVLSPDKTWRRASIDAVWDMAPLVVYVICLVVLLVHIERISALLEAQKELQEAQQRTALVASMKEDLIEHWTAISNVTELWQNRTLPRLDLLKELHCQLQEKLQPEHLTEQLRVINARLGRLEQAVGDVQQWWHAQQEGSACALAPRVSRLLRTRTRDRMQGESGSFTQRLDCLIGEIDAERPSTELVVSDTALDLGGSFKRGSLQEFLREAEPADLEEGNMRNLDSFVADR